MNIPEWIATVLGIAGVALTILQSVWCWPLALFSVGIYTFVFFQSGLYADAGLQLFYIGASVYGWIEWSRKKGDFIPRKFFLKGWSFYFLSVLIQTGIFYVILTKTDSTVPFADASLAAASISTTILMAKKITINWILWVLIDVAYVFLYIYKNLFATAILYGLFAVMAMYGYVSWRKQMTT